MALSWDNYKPVNTKGCCLVSGRWWSLCDHNNPGNSETIRYEIRITSGGHYTDGELYDFCGGYPNTFAQVVDDKVCLLINRGVRGNARIVDELALLPFKTRIRVYWKAPGEIGKYELLPTLCPIGWQYDGDFE